MENTSDKSGYVYVLSNSSIPDMLKIGRTSRNPKERIKELSGATGVPTPFSLEYKHYFSDCIKAEKLVHKYFELNAGRISDRREFFKATVNEAIDIIESVDSKYFNDYTNKIDSLQSSKSWYERDENGNKIEVELKIKPIDPEKDLYEITKIHTYSDSNKDSKKYLTNDLDAFTSKESSSTDDLNPVELTIAKLVNKGLEYLYGYGDEIIDIKKGEKLLEEAISLGSSLAAYHAGVYHLQKHIFATSDENSVAARFGVADISAYNYFSRGSSLDGVYGLRCMAWRMKIDTFERFATTNGYFDYIKVNNFIVYWRKYIEKVNEYGINHADLSDYDIGGWITDFIINDIFISIANENNTVRVQYTRTLNTLISFLKNINLYLYRYYKLTDTDYSKEIKFLEDIFEIDPEKFNLNNMFLGAHIKPISLEDGNYEITGDNKSNINEGDTIVLYISSDDPYFFQVNKVWENSELNEWKLYIEGRLPDYHDFRNFVDQAIKEGDSHPIKITKASSSRSLDKNIEAIVEYCLNWEFEEGLKEMAEENKSSEIKELPNILCPSCHHENQTDGLFCVMCGNPLSTTQEKTMQSPETVFDKFRKWFSNNQN